MAVAGEVPSMERSLCTYTSCYCEENVYLLCKQLCTNRSTEPDLSDLFVVFISNENMQVPIWQQRAGLIADGLVVWDYHVICIQMVHGRLHHQDMIVLLLKMELYIIWKVLHPFQI
eukprot:c21883_g1_i1 orf=170-517(+)